MQVRLKPIRRLGLSLIEVLAVAVILGFLAAIVVPRYSTTTGRAQVETGSFQLAHLNTIVERFYLQTGAFPSQLSDLVPTYLPSGIPAHPDPKMQFSYDSSTGRISEIAK